MHSPRRNSDIYSDRFIPSRTGSQLDNALNLLSSEQDVHFQPHANTAMSTIIKSELLGQGFDSDTTFLESNQSRTSNLLRYKSSAEDSFGGGASNSSSPSGAHYTRANSLPAMSPVTRVSYDAPGALVGRKNRRKISRVPYKVLDAPSLQDDFYLNLVDWSATNVLAVGLSSAVYLWSAYTSKVN